MILVDSSVWIDWFRDVPTRASAHLEQQLSELPALATTEPIVMELLAGAVDDDALESITELAASLTLVGVAPREDFTAAAQLYRRARRQGTTVRKIIDCLIAAVAIRAEAVVWHKDADFAALARVCTVQQVDLR